MRPSAAKQTFDTTLAGAAPAGAQATAVKNFRITSATTYAGLVVQVEQSRPGEAAENRPGGAERVVAGKSVVFVARLNSDGSTTLGVPRTWCNGSCRAG